MALLSEICMENIGSSRLYDTFLSLPDFFKPPHPSSGQPLVHHVGHTKVVLGLKAILSQQTANSLGVEASWQSVSHLLTFLKPQFPHL